MLALIVGPFPEEHTYLRRVLGSLRCKAASAFNVAQGQAIQNVKRPSLIACDSDLPDGSWRDFLASAEGAETPPLIVTSRLADERLWAEVLNLGGYDLLAKPFEKSEVIRAIDMALRRRTILGKSPLAASCARR
jgi:DNA-binding response OmpR family regulator